MPQTSQLVRKDGALFTIHDAYADKPTLLHSVHTLFFVHKHTSLHTSTISDETACAFACTSTPITHPHAQADTHITHKRRCAAHAFCNPSTCSRTTHVFTTQTHTCVHTQAPHIPSQAVQPVLSRTPLPHYEPPRTCRCRLSLRPVRQLRWGIHTTQGCDGPTTADG